MLSSSFAFEPTPLPESLQTCDSDSGYLLSKFFRTTCEADLNSTLADLNRMYKLWRTSITRDNPSVSIPVGRNSSQSTCSETDSRKTHEFGAIGEELECSSMRSSINSESQPVVVGLPGLLKSDAESLQQPAIQNPDDLVINFWNSEPKFKAEYEVPSSDHAAEIIGKKGLFLLQ